MATLRVYGVKLTTTAVAAPTLRVYGVKLVANPAVMVIPISALTVKPESNTRITASVAGGGAATYTWRVISGNGTVTNDGSDTTTFYADSGAPQSVYPPLTQDTQLGVIATVDGVPSVELVVTVHVKPQLKWWMDASGKWRGAKPVQYWDGSQLR